MTEINNWQMLQGNTQDPIITCFYKTSTRCVFRAQSNIKDGALYKNC